MVESYRLETFLMEGSGKEFYLTATALCHCVHQHTHAIFQVLARYLPLHGTSVPWRMSWLKTLGILCECCVVRKAYSANPFVLNYCFTYYTTAAQDMTVVYPLSTCSLSVKQMDS